MVSETSHTERLSFEDKDEAWSRNTSDINVKNLHGHKEEKKNYFMVNVWNKYFTKEIANKYIKYISF